MQIYKSQASDYDIVYTFPTSHSSLSSYLAISPFMLSRYLAISIPVPNPDLRPLPTRNHVRAKPSVSASSALILAWHPSKRLSSYLANSTGFPAGSSYSRT